MRIMDALKPMYDQFQALDDAEKSIFLDMVDPPPELVSTPAKKSRKKPTKTAGKSRRAASLAEKVGGTASRTITGPACTTCGNVEDHPDHDTEHYLSAHPFAGVVPPALRQSSRNGRGVKDDSYAVNSATDQDVARRAAQDSSVAAAGGTNE